MNTYLLLSVLSVFCLCCSSKCPKIIKKHKELLSGLILGLVLCSFFGVNLNNVEGFDIDELGVCLSSDIIIPSGITKGDYCLCAQDATLPGCNPPTATPTTTPTTTPTPTTTTPPTSNPFGDFTLTGSTNYTVPAG
jgi:hypothetical protein